MHQWRLFFTAVEYFTRLPKPGWVGYDPAWLRQCARYFPAVGVIVGLVAATVYGAARMVWPAPVAVLLSLVATLLVTGAFHEDGFADVCDGLGGALDRERALQIMTDSRVGAFGAIGMAVLLMLKVASVAALGTVAAMVALVVAHTVSRALPLLLMASLPYAKPLDASKAKPVAEGVGQRELAIGLLTAAGVLVVATGAPLWPAGSAGYALPAGRGDSALWRHATPWVLALAGAGAVTLASAVPLRAWFRRRLGGYTGDCLGAAQQVGEVLFYLVFGALLGHT
jgi:adenosylcobinamide-GDP ribazoletransferase